MLPRNEAYGTPASASLSHVLGPCGPLLRRTGIEQEFAVIRDVAQVDFKRWIQQGSVPGRRLDASDPNAHRLDWGGVITADGREAEIATPPAPLTPGFTGTLRDSLNRLRWELASVIGDESLHGVSTHVNIEVRDRIVRRAAHRFANRHAGAMMLLLDRRDSPGLLVRPRPGRLELGGEYAVGVQLAAATVFAAAAAVECERPLLRAVPVSPRLEAAHGRYGWYVDRGAFGNDLYLSGRACRLGRYRAQDLLDWSWDRVRPHAQQLVSAAEVSVVDALVGGDHPLPSELPDEDHGSVHWAHLAHRREVDVTANRTAGTSSLTPLVVNWDWALYALQRDGTRRYVALPALRAAAFVEGFTSGSLDGWLRTMLAVPPGRLGVLNDSRQVGGGRAFAGVSPGLSLTRSERDPATGRLSGPHSPRGTREHKHDSDTSGPEGRAAATTSWPRKGYALAGGAVLVVAAVAVLLTSGILRTDPDPRDTSADASGAASPGARQNEAFALSMAGTYDVTATVTDGNTSLPVGTTTERTVVLRTDCSATSCTLQVEGVGKGTVSNGALHVSGTVTEPCPLDDSVTIQDAFDLVLRATGGATPAAGFSGTLRIESLNVEECRDARDVTGSDPVTYSWTGVRR